MLEEEGGLRYGNFSKFYQYEGRRGQDHPCCASSARCG